MIIRKKRVLLGLSHYMLNTATMLVIFTYLPEAFSEDVHLKVRIYKEYHSVCPLVGIGTLPPPLSPASVPLPQNGGGAHSPAGEGLGESQFRRLEKKLSTLPTLWRILYHIPFTLISWRYPVIRNPDLIYNSKK
jgi:hypothetical protein